MARRAINLLMSVALLVFLASCASEPKEAPDEGLFHGYDFGNRADMQEIRRDRPDYRDYE